MSASSLVSGTPASVPNVATWIQRVSLVAGGVAAQFVITPPFAVNDQLTIQYSVMGRAATGLLYATTVNGAAGAGTVTIQSANAGDVGLVLSVQLTLNTNV
jgi:predicted Na+-dependent transporter